MKIVALSDLHGNLPEYQFECDVVCICGDIVPLQIQANHKKCRQWLRNEFIPWTNTLKCDKVILVAGNHDFFFDGKLTEEIDSWFDFTKIIYLDNELYEYQGIKFFGSPYCKIFGNWAFMRSPEVLKNKFYAIPEHVDVLLTHDAPYGVSDICLDPAPWNTKEHIGNSQLEEAILLRKPRYNLHGHLHSTNHQCEMLKNTEVYNVSIKNEEYEIAYEPLTLEIEPIC